MTHQGLNRDDEMRIILIGKTGNGKSASGNTLLQRQAFVSRCAPRPVTSECEKAEGMVNGRRITVIDTPGIYDTKYKQDEVETELKKCIFLSSPGPHAFLIVVKLGRFTEEEQKTVELLQKVFGDKAADYSMVLFTYGDQLEDTTIEEFISPCPELTGLTESCKGRYHVFNNEDKNIRQVSELVKKIDKMVITNGGGHYTNEMFQEAERAIEEEKQRILKAEEKRRQEEINTMKLKIDELEAKLKMVHEENERKAREQAEKEKERIKTFQRAIEEKKQRNLKATKEAGGGIFVASVATGGVIGAVTDADARDVISAAAGAAAGVAAGGVTGAAAGAAAGAALAGPAGMAIGAAVGAVFGATAALDSKK